MWVMVLSIPQCQKGSDMTTAQDTEFQKLLKAWNEHQELRQQNAPISHLVESRSALDEARLQLALAA